jgi:nicotinamidase-related amidase
MKGRQRNPRQALLILDMLSEYRFSNWQATLAAARRIAPRIARLKSRAHRAGAPVVYVNDMADRWQSDQKRFLRQCLAEGARGRDTARLLAPTRNDYFIFKPKHSGFYGTPLAELLQSGNVRQLVLTGTTSHQCVLFTAMDAYVRNYDLVTPADCLGAPTAAQTRHALFILKNALRARTGSSSAVVFTSGTKLDSAGVSD